jgi:putative DNA primase/helicase
MTRTQLNSKETIDNIPTLKSLNIEEFLALSIPPREMILSPIIPHQGLVMLYAMRGIGKTYVALTIACTIAGGGEMFAGKWQSPKTRKVLFIDGEMPISVLQERLATIVANNNLQAMSQNLRIITPDLQDLGIPDLSTAAGQVLMEEHLEGVSLIILDNLSSLCRTGKENESESWNPIQTWLLSLRKRGISVLIIHHANKNGNQRGNSKKEDLLDTVVALITMAFG